MKRYFLYILLMSTCTATNPVPLPVPRPKPQEKPLLAIGFEHNNNKDHHAVTLALELSRICNIGTSMPTYHALQHLVLSFTGKNSSGITVMDSSCHKQENFNFYIGNDPANLLDKWLYIERAYVRGDFSGLGFPDNLIPRYKKYRLVTLTEDSFVLYGSLKEGDSLIDPFFEVVREQGKNMQASPKPGERMIAFAYKNYLFTRSSYLDDKDVWKHPDAKVDSSRKLQVYRLPSDDVTLMKILREFVDIQHGEMSPIKNAKDIYLAASLAIHKDQVRNTRTEIEDYVMEIKQRDKAHDLYPDNSGSKTKREYGLKDGPIHNTIPNVNEGKCTESAVQSFIKQHPGYSRTYSEGGKVSYAATVQSTGNRIDYQIAHHANPDQAMNMLFHFIAEFANFWSPIPESSKRYVRYKPGSGPLKSLGRVGDFDMPLKDYLTPDGMLIEGSDKSAVFFIRGNTAVGIQSVDPTVDVLPWAKEIDEKLKKNLERSAAEKEPQTPSLKK